MSESRAALPAVLDRPVRMASVPSYLRDVFERLPVPLSLEADLLALLNRGLPGARSADGHGRCEPLCGQASRPRSSLRGRQPDRDLLTEPRQQDVRGRIQYGLMNEQAGGLWEEGLAVAEGAQHPGRMSDQSPRKGATYEDLEKLPSNVIGELVGGELYVSPRPASRHALATTVLADELVGPFGRGKGGPGGWLLLFEPELHLGKDVLVPDLAGWRRERMPEMPDTVGFTIPPDWACEVLSPSTTVLDRGRKMGVYAREGVRHAWLVDPAARMLEVYRLEGGRWLLLGTHVGAVEVRAEPFEAIALELGALWAR